jgi:[CysO sulfur-carrier protein]-S-L-cysteine hydrolase
VASRPPAALQCPTVGRIFRIRAGILSSMIEHARREAPWECCGLLAGHPGATLAIFPAANALGGATRYEIAPEELFSLLRAIRDAGLELTGIYHSHPRGDNYPSRADIDRAYYPQAAYLILDPRDSAGGAIRAFHIRDGCVTEMPIEPFDDSLSP